MNENENTWRELVVRYRQSREEIAEKEAGDCPDEELLTRYLEHGLDASGREDMERHISLCESCIDYVIVMNRILRSSEEEAVVSMPDGMLERAKRWVKLEKEPQQKWIIDWVKEVMGVTIPRDAVTLAERVYIFARDTMGRVTQIIPGPEHDHFHLAPEVVSDFAPRLSFKLERLELECRDDETIESRSIRDAVKFRRTEREPLLVSAETLPPPLFYVLATRRPLENVKEVLDSLQKKSQMELEELIGSNLLFFSTSEKKEGDPSAK